jgi:hypothetical protein
LRTEIAGNSLNSFFLKWFQNVISGSRARRRPIEKAQSRRRRDEPSKRPATQPLSLRWGFETTSYQIAQVGVKLILLDKITKNDINNRFKRGRDDTRLY